MHEERLYLAYGSNINLRQMGVRCPAAEPVRPGVLEDYRLAFRASGVATILPEEGSKVHGLLWKLTPQCEAALDAYEGYPRFYEKKDVTVKDSNGASYRVMAYIMTPEHACVLADPLPGYSDEIRYGYVQNGMPTGAFDQAVKRAREEAAPYRHSPWQDFGQNTQQKHRPKKKDHER